MSRIYRVRALHRGGRLVVHSATGDTCRWMLNFFVTNKPVSVRV